MKPASFDYLRATSVEEAVQTLAEHGDDARVLAGGQSMVPVLNMRLATPGLLVDVWGLDETAAIRPVDGVVEVGASVTQAALLAWPDLGQRLPLVAAALPHVGHMQIRARGTVCGSIAHADPGAELPLCLAVLGGEVVLRSRRGTRIVPASAFQVGMMVTARAADEMVVAARFPVAGPGTGDAFHEVAARHGDFAIVAIAVQASTDRLRVGVGGVADRPTVMDAAPLAGDDLDDALNDLAWRLGAVDDAHATARYRREMVRRIGRRAVGEAMACRS